MRINMVKPSIFLNNYIKHYCFMESDICDGNIIERVIPAENIQLMFHYKDPFVTVHSNDRVVKQPRSIISGLNDSYANVSTNGETGVVFVSFYPAGACHFFNFPLSEIENQNVDLSDIFSTDIRQIEEMLFLKDTIKNKVSVIEKYLLSRFSPIPSYDSLLIRKGVDFIKSCKAQTTASSLSDSLSITTKSLERKFSQYLGKTTKQFIKLIRFQEILQDFSVNKNISLTQLAYNNGYFDQSHFIRDFKTYSGYTPKEFITKYPDFNINHDFC